MALPDISTHSTTPTLTTTRITQPARLNVVRVSWVILVTISTLVGLFTLWSFAAGRLDRCLAEPCSPLQMLPTTVAKYQAGGIPFEASALLRPVLEAIAATTYMLVGIVIFRRRSDDWMGLLTSLMLCFLGFRLTGVSGAISLVLPELYGLGVFLTSVMFISTYGTLYLMPNGRFYPRWAVVPFTVTIIYELLRGFLVYSPDIALSNISLMQLGGIALGGIGLYCQFLRYKGLSPSERQQLKWLLLATGLLLAGLSISAIHNIVLSSLDGVAYSLVTLLAFISQYALFIGLPLAFAFSILRYRLWDADIVINRTLVYAGVTVMLGVMFFALFFMLKAILQTIIGTDTTVPLMIATASVVAAFNPVRVRLARFVDKQIYGFRVELADIRKRPAHETQFVGLTHAADGQYSGKHVAGYRLGGVLGKGGMGEVYAAQAMADDAMVAVKILPPELAAQREPLARFELEAEVLARLSHPQIVRVLGAGMADGLHYLVMELIEGVSLSDRLKHGQPISRAEAIGIITDIAAALEAAHIAGIVHRDVKPSNVMLRPTGQAVLTDFGIAKLVQDSTGALTQSNLVGTLDYIAPEQIIASRGVDHRADIYALGVIAYQLLVGTHPFAGGGVAALVFAHLNQPAPDPRDTHPDFPRPIALALLKALAKKPQDRYASAMDFARALTQ